MRSALLTAGFRPFFIGAVMWSALAMLVWAGILSFGWQPGLSGLPATVWHAHTMIFGYAIAVIAGFLLTAVANWTDRPALSGLPLAGLVGLWIIARALSLAGNGSTLLLLALVDVLFSAGLLAAVAVPIMHSRQWRQAGILAKILLLGVANATFYLGVAGLLDHGIRWGLYSGFYLVLALVLTMGQRVIPGFIERGLGLTHTLRNRKWITISSLLLFLMFWIAEVFVQSPVYSAVLAGMLFVVHLVRLYDWHVQPLWRKPLLWTLYLAYGFMVGGFALQAATLFVPSLPPFLPVHAFAVGGIGLITLGMMARVSLGHTGRNIHSPPRLLAPALLCLLLSALVRVVPPLFDMTHYMIWINLSQFLWISAFLAFLCLYMPMLFKPRITTGLEPGHR